MLVKDASPLPSDARTHGGRNLMRLVIFWMKKVRQAGDRIGGLGSSHTTPCGAAVPARPPTRSSETTHVGCKPQWVTRATRRGTRVVVQRGHLWPKTKLMPQSKLLIISKIGKRMHQLPWSVLPIVLIQFRRNLIQLFCFPTVSHPFNSRTVHPSVQPSSSGHVPAGVRGYS
jgi:hypothetical protein